MNGKGFTLAEILGVIVVVGVLLVLLAPTITRQLSNNKSKSNAAFNKIIYEITSQYVDENKDQYLNGNKYCIRIQQLIDSGFLNSPVTDVSTGKNIDNYSVLVYIYSSGGRDYDGPFTHSECTAKSGA